MVTPHGFCSQYSQSPFQNKRHLRRNPTSYENHRADCLTRPWRLVPVTKHAEVNVVAVKDTGDGKVSEITSQFSLFLQVSRWCRFAPSCGRAVQIIHHFNGTSTDQQGTETFNLDCSDTLYCLPNTLKYKSTSCLSRMLSSDWLRHLLSILL